MVQSSSPRYNHYQPIAFDYSPELTQNVIGYVMPFPNLEQFNLHYGEEEQNAPTRALSATLQLLLPQIRCIQIDPSRPWAFLAYEEVDPEILSLIFQRWTRTCYPAEAVRILEPLCTADQFVWRATTTEDLAYWKPAWAFASELMQHEYELNEESFKFLLGPNRYSGTNSVELVSWPPFRSPRNYRASINLTISTQSDIAEMNVENKIYLHFGMKRWVVKPEDNESVRLQDKTTGCYVRRLTPWLGETSLRYPSTFTVIEANYRRESNGSYTPQWKMHNGQWFLQLLQQLSVSIPDITTILENSEAFVSSDTLNILVPARAYQRTGWGTGFPFSDRRKLLQQIVSHSPPSTQLLSPWKKIATSSGSLREHINAHFQRWKSSEIIPKPKANGTLVKLSTETKDFLRNRAKNQTIHVYCLQTETRDALQRVADHYFQDSLTLIFHDDNEVSQPIEVVESRGRNVPDVRHIRAFANRHEQQEPTPVIVEILSPKHQVYRFGRDPKSRIKSILPQYNLIPQCILSPDMGYSRENQRHERDAELEKNIDNRAIAAIIDALVPFDQHPPLSVEEDNNVYAGLYVIQRNSRTASCTFKTPVVSIIHRNHLQFLLPEIDLELRSMDKAICKLAQTNLSSERSDAVIDNMLSTLSRCFSEADNIYLFTHGQNARYYWRWLQDSQFLDLDPPNTKIHIIRIRDGQNNEVPQGYALSKASESFAEGIASFGQGMFIPEAFELNKQSFTQSVLSLTAKPRTSSKLKKDTSFTDFPSHPWKSPQPRLHNILSTSRPSDFFFHHAIAHHLRSRHWWTPDDCQYPLPLTLAAKLKEWTFNEAPDE